MSTKDFPEGLNLGRLSLNDETGVLRVRGPLTTGIANKVYANMEEVVNAAGEEAVLASYNVPGTLLRDVGNGVDVLATGHSANTLGAKTYKFYCDTTVEATIVSPQSAVLSWVLEAHIARRSATELHIHARMFDSDGTTGALGTQWAEFHADLTHPAGASVLVKVTGTAAGGAADDVMCDMLLVRSWS